METESADIDPQQHLRQLDDAATAARRDAHQRTPLWFWPAMALLAPLIVSFRSTTGGTRVALVVMCATPVLIAFAVAWRQGIRKRSRGKAGLDQGPGLWWKFLGLFFFIVGIQMAGSLLSMDAPIRTAIFTYLFIAIPCTLFFWRFDAKQKQSTTLYGKLP